MKSCRLHSSTLLTPNMQLFKNLEILKMPSELQWHRRRTLGGHFHLSPREARGLCRDLRVQLLCELTLWLCVKLQRSTAQRRHQQGQIYVLFIQSSSVRRSLLCTVNLHMNIKLWETQPPWNTAYIYIYYVPTLHVRACDSSATDTVTHSNMVVSPLLSRSQSIGSSRFISGATLHQTHCSCDTHPDYIHKIWCW